MTRNTWEDGTPFSVASLNSLKHAFQGEGVESGGALSPGTGDWDVDITATDYTVGSSGGFSLTSDTVTVSNPGAEDRVDLITATTAPAFNVVEGSVASTTDKPNAPDIPSDEVLVGVVYVDSAASSLAAADLFDGYKTPVQNVENWTTSGAEGTAPVSDGNNALVMRPRLPFLASTDGLWWDERFDTVDNTDQATSGGSITLRNSGTGELRVQSGGTNGNTANIRRRFGASRLLDFSKDNTVEFDLDVATTADRTTVFWGDQLNDLTRIHIGLKVTGGDILGSVADGTTESTTTLVSGASTGKRRIRVEFTAGSDATFFDASDDSQLGQITTTLPSGTQNVIWSANASNGTGTQTQIDLYDIRGVMHP